MTHSHPVLAIDARPLSRGTGGIQRYLQKSLPHLIDSGEFDIILYSDKPINGLSSSHLRKVRLRQLSDNMLKTTLWHIVIPVWLFKDKVDVFWSPRHHLPILRPKHCKAIVTIHDFVWKTVPETMPVIQRLSEQLLMPHAIKSADGIVCISKTTEKQLQHYYPKRKAKSCVILHGTASIEMTAINAATEKMSPFILAVGSLEPRKNYRRLIQAFDQYRNQGGLKRLVIVGKNGWHFEKIYQTLSTAEHQSSIRILNNSNDQELRDLYRKASAFISPSLDEGYGLPAQEAALHGQTLLLADIEAYRELQPQADTWFSPTSVNDITRALHSADQTFTSPSSRRSPTHRWSDSSQQLLDFIKQV